MLPREFLDRYGRVVVRTTAALALGEQIAPANPDRYLLWVYAETPTDIGIGVPGGTVYQMYSMAGAGGQLELTHALHGALVNEEFVVAEPLGGGPFTVVEGFMRPARLPARKGR